jgi:hypothetical protein
LEFVTQVVKGVRLALSVSAERCLGGCDQVVEVRERQGESAAEIAELLAWGRDDFECVRDGADDAGRVVVGVDCLWVVLTSLCSWPVLLAVVAERVDDAGHDVADHRRDAGCR